MTTVINLFGGPGCGKSTLALEIAYTLKKGGVKSELVREFVKDWAWEGRKIGPYDQIEISAAQAKREYALYNKVDVVVTDSPLLLGPFYQEHYGAAPMTLASILELLKYAESQGVRYLNFFLSRNKAYDPSGRYETEEQAQAIDLAMARFLDTQGVPYIRIDCPDALKCQAVLDLAAGRPHLTLAKGGVGV